LSLPI